MVKTSIKTTIIEHHEVLITDKMIREAFGLPENAELHIGLESNDLFYPSEVAIYLADVVGKGVKATWTKRLNT